MDFEKFTFKEKYKDGLILSFDFCIRTHTGHKRNTFNSYISLLHFLKQNPEKLIHITLDTVEDFEVSGENLIINLKAYQDFCKSIGENGQNRAQAFFARRLRSYTEEEKKEVILQASTAQIGERIKDFSPQEISNLLLNLKTLNKDQVLQLVRNNKNLTTSDLQEITNVIDTSKIDKALEIWQRNKLNSQEVEFWQPFFKDNFWIISQIFSCPIVLYDDEFYAGGIYQGSMKGGKNIDFLGQNKLSKNVVIIEIKHPKISLVSKTVYTGRRGIYPMSSDFMGALSQTLNQKDTIQKFYQKHAEYSVFNPKTILIIGSEENEKMNEDQRACFELFKNSNKEIEIITFDELFEKIKNLRSLLSSTKSPTND